MSSIKIDGLQIFIPVYNEFSSVARVAYNVNRAQKVFPGIHFHIYDNASTDGTYEYLLDLQKNYPESVFVERNECNIGFSRNLSNIDKLPKDRMILILGANDLLYTPGLRKLKALLVDHYDLIIANWAYAETSEGGDRMRILAIHDVKIPFGANTLDEYFKLHKAVPNGIMQWVIHPKHAHLFARHTQTLSPQLGAFFDLFPGKVYAMGRPPVAIVNEVENDGWRSSVERILETHVAISSATICSLNENLKKRKISLETYLKVRYFYTRVLIFFAYKSQTKHSWGQWQRKKKISQMGFLSSFFWSVLTMRPNRYLNWFFLSGVPIEVLGNRLFRRHSVSKKRLS